MPQTAPLLDNATTLNVNYAFSSKKKRNEQNSQISSVLPGNVHVYLKLKMTKVLRKMMESVFS